VYDGYTGCFIVTFPYIHALYSKLVHPLVILPPTPLPFLRWLQQVSELCSYPPLPSSLPSPFPLTWPNLPSSLLIVCLFFSGDFALEFHLRFCTSAASHTHLNFISFCSPVMLLCLKHERKMSLQSNKLNWVFVLYCCSPRHVCFSTYPRCYSPHLYHHDWYGKKFVKAGR
jgi:hypothetical protein